MVVDKFYELPDAPSLSFKSGEVRCKKIIEDLTLEVNARYLPNGTLIIGADGANEREVPNGRVSFIPRS